MREAVTATAREQELVTEVIRSLCKRPELLRIAFEDYDTMVHVCITAHPTDVKILLGSGGSHLSALAGLTRLIFHGTGKLVQYLPIESTEHEEIPYTKMQAKKDWPEAKMLDLAKRITEGVFPQSKVRVRRIPEKASYASTFEISVAGDLHESAWRRFSFAVAVLMLPMGTNVGHMIYAVTKKGT